MTTLAQLIDDCEADLADSGNATWSAADIEQWCRDAIGDYSQHFPFKNNYEITCSVGDKTYQIVDDQYIDVISVEFPKGEDPPQYLFRKHYLSADFWQEDGYYDVVAPRDFVSDRHELWISNSPTAISQKIVVEYH